jgi:hypothetical protein
MSVEMLQKILLPAKYSAVVFSSDITSVAGVVKIS